MSSLPIVSIIRRETFSSAHRLHSPFLSDEENKKVYVKARSSRRRYGRLLLSLPPTSSCNSKGSCRSSNWYGDEYN
uniref:Large type 6-pyrovoyltetrahydropterin synthase n=1 Tax=Bombyx mori TaxID=7091 RepID=S6BKZ6_BOMMO|nr:large type 6-pyrovoyltetrahydropterin synthase [Bombyx mori]